MFFIRFFFVVRLSLSNLRTTVGFAPLALGKLHKAEKMLGDDVGRGYMPGT